MDRDFFPVVNGCYINGNNEMFKVRMLVLSGNNIRRVTMEDMFGNLRTMSMNSWQNLHLIPCCKTSNHIRHIS